MSYVMEWVLILAEALLTVLMLATMLNLANPEAPERAETFAPVATLDALFTLVSELAQAIADTETNNRHFADL